MIDASGAKVLIPPRQNEWSVKPDRVFSVARAIMTSKGRFMGIVEVQQNFSSIENICQPGQTAWQTIVVNHSDQLIYPASLGEYEAGICAALKDVGQKGELTLPGTKTDKWLYSSSISEYTGLRVYTLRPKSEVFHSIAVAFQFVAYALMAVLVATILVMGYITKTLTFPLRQLRQSMENIDIGHMDIPLDANVGNDEVEQLNRTFVRMLARIDLSVRQTAQAQREEARAHLLALQSQMTPHFLYNTLNTISILADECGQDNIRTISSYLVNMLRYVGDYSRTKVMLKQEIEYTQQYLFLLKARYESALEFSFRISGDPSCIEVPKLILQPLVENAYKHGLSAVSPPWSILVEVEVRENGFSIATYDNGGGFDSEILKNLQKRIAGFRVSDNAFSEIKDLRLDNIGLLNTYSRLYLEYGSCVRMEMRNNPDGGSCVYIAVLPTGKGESHDDLSHNDC